MLPCLYSKEVIIEDLIMANIYKDFYDYPITKEELHNCEIMTHRARLEYLLHKKLPNEKYRILWAILTKKNKLKIMINFNHRTNYRLNNKSNWEEFDCKVDIKDIYAADIHCDTLIGVKTDKFEIIDCKWYHLRRQNKFIFYRKIKPIMPKITAKINYYVNKEKLTMNYEQVLDELRELKEIIKSQNEIIEKLQDKIEIQKENDYRFIPQEGQDFYIATSNNSIQKIKYNSSLKMVKEFVQYLNCFKTENEAKLENIAILIDRKIKNIINRFNYNKNLNKNNSYYLDLIFYDDRTWTIVHKPRLNTDGDINPYKLNGFIVFADKYQCAIVTIRNELKDLIKEYIDLYFEVNRN